MAMGMKFPIEASEDFRPGDRIVFTFRAPGERRATVIEGRVRGDQSARFFWIGECIATMPWHRPKLEDLEP